MTPPESPRSFSDTELELLLRQGRLPDARRERVLAGVLAGVARSEPMPGKSAPSKLVRWRWLAAAALACGSAAAFVVLRSPAHSEWQARGVAGGGFAIEVGCSGGTLERCPLGSTLIFRAQAPSAPGYLLAYADPVDHAGQRVWYFSGAGSPAIAAGEAPELLSRGIRLGSEHVPGAYRLHVLVTRQPVAPTRAADLGRADVLSAQQLRLVVTP